MNVWHLGGPPVVGAGGVAAPAERVLADESGGSLRLGPAGVTGDDIATAQAPVAGDFSVAWEV